MQFIRLQDMNDRLRLDEEHARRVHKEGRKDYLINVGDDLLAFEPLIAAQVACRLEVFNDGSNMYQHKVGERMERVYVWHDVRNRQIFLGTRKDVVGDIGEDETAKIDAMYIEKFGSID